MSRRGENIYKRKDGRWEGRYIKGRDVNNKAVYGYKYGKSYSEVKLSIKQASAAESADISKPLSFGRIAEDWLENKKLNVKESTLSHYRTIMDKHILPVLGKSDISQISSERIQRHMNTLIESGYACKTVGDILTVIKSVFKYADCKGIRFNCRLSMVNIKSKKSEIEALTIFEQKKLSAYLTDNMNYRNFGILLSLYTGIRIGELCALKWSDINVKERTLKIDKTMLRIQNNLGNEKAAKTKVIVTPPKSEDSARIIPVPEFIIRIMKSLKINRNAYVLTGLENSFTEPRNLQYYFKTVLTDCGLRDVKFHILRHTFATRCVENGFEIKSLSEILGHSDIKITLERYVHSSMELKRKNMEKLVFLSA